MEELYRKGMEVWEDLTVNLPDDIPVLGDLDEVFGFIDQLHDHSEPWSGYRERLFHYLAVLGAGTG